MFPNMVEKIYLHRCMRVGSNATGKLRVTLMCEIEKVDQRATKAITFGVFIHVYAFL